SHPLVHQAQHAERSARNPGGRRGGGGFSVLRGDRPSARLRGARGPRAHRCFHAPRFFFFALSGPGFSLPPLPFAALPPRARADTVPAAQPAAVTLHLVLQPNPGMDAAAPGVRLGTTRGARRWAPATCRSRRSASARRATPP